jgi:hypothetical protein
MRFAPLAALAFLAIHCSSTAQSINADRILADIKYLSDDNLKGRGTGTPEEIAAADYISKQFAKLKLTPKGGNGGWTQQFPFKGGIHGTGAEGTARNVIAYLDNKAAQTIILGAHFDHLGEGNDGSSLDANPQGKIHNGADDNASGTAGVLELARYYTKNRKTEKHNYLFILFSGEELGLFGSKYFTEHPTLDLSTVNYMINLDMVGRLDPAGKGLSISGSGTSPVWETLIKELAGPALNVKTDSSGTGPSDHTSFYLKNIPVLHFFTGSHGDYHKPSDDWEKINAAGEADVLNLIVKINERLDSEPKLAFLPTRSRVTTASRAFKVTLGVMPSYSSDAEGLKIDGVTDGKPAQKAGLLAGDVITQIGEYPIKDITAYMETLSRFEKGQTAKVKVLRGKEELTFEVTF